MGRIFNEYNLNLQFEPSLIEIQEASSDAYMGTLADFYKSVEKLKDSVQHRYSKIKVIEGPRRRAFKPEDFIQIAFMVSSMGGVAALFKLLKLWVELKNGRKIKVKMGDFEVDTTQMSPRQFSKFVAKLQAFRERIPKGTSDDDRILLTRKFTQGLKADGTKVVEIYSDEYVSEKQTLRKAISVGLEKARSRRE